MIATSSTSTSSSGITAPMNINAVIAHLVEMTPPQRKQFAQMHMDDPMMLSAAKFVDNQITKQAAAMSAQRMGAAPPPVNQQVVAQMSPQPPVPQAAPMPQAAPQQQAAPQDQGQAQPMPEDTGIAQLPAQNMEGMADGGIVGYAEGGGPVAGVYVPNTVPPGAFIMGNMYTDPETGERGYLPGRGPGKGLSGYEGITLGDIAKKAKEKLEDLVVSGTYNKQKLAERRQAADAAKVPALLNKDAPAYTGPSASARKDDKVKRNPDNYKPADAAPKKKVGIDQLRADKVESAPPSTAQATVTTTAADEDYAAAYDRILKKQGDPRANLPPEIQANANLAKAQGEKELASADKRALGLQALVDERNTRLAGREKNVKDQEELNPNMSLITAGLAMMQSTGKGLAGVAEGATKGLAQYMDGVKYNSAQRQKLEDARDALADLKFNQENMTEKERLAAQNTITQGAIAANNAVVTTIQHREGVNAQTAGRILDIGARQSLEGQRQQFEIGMQGQRLESQERLTKAQMANALKAANINAGTRSETDFYEKLGSAAPDSALRKGFDLKQQIAKDPVMYETYTKLATDELKGEAFVKRFPTFESFKAGMTGKGGGGTMPNPGWGAMNVK